MGGVNKVILIGRLGADPEVRHGKTGQAVCTLSLATSEQWTDKEGNRQERAEWHRIVVWGKTAEHCGQYLSKGREVFVEGRIQSRKYTDRDGNERTSYEIKAFGVTFLGSRNDTQSVGQFPSSSGQGAARRGNTGWGGAPNQKATQNGVDPIPF